MTTQAHAVARDRRPHHASEGPTAGRERGARILIVDDIADNRIILARRFARRGFEIVEADDGEQALKLIEQQTFDVVLLDLMMPGIGGIDVLKIVRQSYSQLDLPIIMVTARTAAEDVVEALQHQANDYVTKPVNFEVALARVNAQIERKRVGEELRRANEALRHANEDLERRVDERTRSLTDINLALKDEIAQREKSEAHSRFLAFHDPLTGLPNRRKFRDELMREIASSGAEAAPPVVVLFVDLDAFKDVNDALGHSFGDLLLQEVAAQFRDVIGPSDHIARFGGDEFAILRTNASDWATTVALADRLIEIAGQLRTIQGHEILIGASIGIVSGAGPEDDPDDLLKAADLAMYRAKLEGRGIYRVFNPTMAAEVRERRALELDLRNAQRLGQLEVFYQPQVSLSTRRLTGFEALLRWRHPGRGMVSPAEFIPLAEETGLINAIGNWTLQAACREAAGWPDDLSIAVNVSSIQFARGDLINAVMQALAHSGLSPSRLELEITESALLTKTQHNIDVLSRLRTLGCKIAMDDFGTGYASLSYLRMFPFDKIKIDRSFISDLFDDENCGAIVKSVLDLSYSCGIKSIAEGVETEDQLNYLTEAGCDEVQGYFYSKPIPAAETRELISTYEGKTSDEAYGSISAPARDKN